MQVCAKVFVKNINDTEAVRMCNENETLIVSMQQIAQLNPDKFLKYIFLIVLCYRLLWLQLKTHIFSLGLFCGLPVKTELHAEVAGVWNHNYRSSPP